MEEADLLIKTRKDEVLILLWSYKFVKFGILSMCLYVCSILSYGNKQFFKSQRKST